MGRYWKSGIWQIEISQELLAKYIDNYIKNVSIKVDNKSVKYNSNNELSVPFDNETIYEENGVWKAKQSGKIPSDVIKDSDLNKDYIDKENGKYIVKTSQDINLKQDKLISGTNIKTINGNSLLGSGDISISVGNDWEEVDTSDFVSNSNNFYVIKNYDKDNYSYQVFVQNNENNPIGGWGGMVITHPKFPFSVKVTIETNDGLFFYVSFSQGKIISYKNKEGIPAKIQGLYIQRKKINYSNNTELMTDERHSIYKPDMDAYLSKKTSDSYFNSDKKNKYCNNY